MGSEVPSGWQLLPLAKVTTAIRNGSSATQSNDRAGPPVSRIETIADGRINMSRVRYLSSTEGLSRYLLRHGDILFSHINSVAHIAKSALYNGQEPLYHGMNLLMLRPDPRNILPFYLHAALQLEASRRFYRSVCKKAINQASLNTGDVGALPVLLPPLPEQKKIAAILSSMDEAIQATQAVIEQTRRVKEGLLQDLLTRGIDHKQFKQTEIGPYGPMPEGWSVRSAEDACSLVTTGRTPSSQYLSDTGEVPFIRGGNLTFDGLLDTTNLLYVEREVHRGQLGRSILRPGDVLTNVIGPPLGQVVQVDDRFPEWNFNQNIVLYRAAPHVLDAAFLALFLRWRRSQRVFHSWGQQTGGQVYLNLSMCRALPILIPPLSEQQSIVERVAAAEQVAHSAQREATGLVEVKTGLLQDLLTGKVRVSV